MAISFDKALGNQETGLALRMKRAELISTNMSNAEVPGYKPTDFDVSKAFDRHRAEAQGVHDFTRTYSTHLSVAGKTGDERALVSPDELVVDHSRLASTDGNRVSLDKERAKFLENQIRLNAANMFLSKRFASLQKAMKGVNG